MRTKPLSARFVYEEQVLLAVVQLGETARETHQELLAAARRSIPDSSFDANPGHDKSFEYLTDPSGLREREWEERRPRRTPRSVGLPSAAGVAS
jgi:hypothetical protein